jgi:hypothetical protein
MSEKCKGKTKRGRPCSRLASPGLNGYCPWHYPPDGGASKQAPGPGPKGGGSGGSNVTLGLTILNTLKNVWDFIKENLPDILSLNARQERLLLSMKQAKNNVERGELLTQLLKSLTTAQMLELVSGLAAHAKKSRTSPTQWLQVLSLLLSLASKQSKESTRV